MPGSALLMSEQDLNKKMEQSRRGGEEIRNRISLIYKEMNLQTSSHCQEEEWLKRLELPRGSATKVPEIMENIIDRKKLNAADVMMRQPTFQNITIDLMLMNLAVSVPKLVTAAIKKQTDISREEHCRFSG